MKIREIIDFVQQKNIFDMLVKALTEQMPLGRDGLTWHAWRVINESTLDTSLLSLIRLFSYDAGSRFKT